MKLMQQSLIILSALLTLTKGSIIRLKRQQSAPFPYNTPFYQQRPLSAHQQLPPQQQYGFLDSSGNQHDKPIPQSAPVAISSAAKSFDGAGQALTLGEAAHVAQLSSPHASAPVRKDKSKKRKTVTPKLIEALQGLKDSQVIDIIASQTGGKVRLTPEQVKQFKALPPETLADMINSGTLSGTTANVQIPNVSSNVNSAPPNDRLPSIFSQPPYGSYQHGNGANPKQTQPAKAQAGPAGYPILLSEEQRQQLASYYSKIGK